MSISIDGWDDGPKKRKRRRMRTGRAMNSNHRRTQRFDRGVYHIPPGTSPQVINTEQYAVVSRSMRARLVAQQQEQERREVEARRLRIERENSSRTGLPTYGDSERVADIRSVNRRDEGARRRELGSGEDIQEFGRGGSGKQRERFNRQWKKEVSRDAGNRPVVFRTRANPYYDSGVRFANGRIVSQNYVKQYHTFAIGPPMTERELRTLAYYQQRPEELLKAWALKKHGITGVGRTTKRNHDKGGTRRRRGRAKGAGVKAEHSIGRRGALAMRTGNGTGSAGASSRAGSGLSFGSLLGGRSSVLRRYGNVGSYGK